MSSSAFQIGEVATRSGVSVDTIRYYERLKLLLRAARSGRGLTLGEQRRVNYALQPMTKEEFIKIVAADRPEFPAYFPKNASKNLQGASALDDLPKPKTMTTEEIKDFDGVVLDVRVDSEFSAAHVLNALNIGLNGQFASWAGTVVEVGTPIAIAAANREKVDEAVMRLARVGIETVQGFILMKDYTGETKKIEQISVGAIKEKLAGDIQFIDVRRPTEHVAGHVPKTMNLPLDRLAKEVGNLNPDEPIYVLCQGGYRSSLGTSILENAGFKKIHNVTGGTKAWTNAGFDTEVSAGAACANS